MDLIGLCKDKTLLCKRNSNYRAFMLMKWMEVLIR